MKNWTLFLLPLLLASTPQGSLAQYQALMDAPEVYLQMVGVRPAPEGGTYSFAKPGTQSVVVASRFNSAGELLWAKSYSPIGEGPMVVEGVAPWQGASSLLYGWRSPLHFDDPDSDHDTIYMRHGFAVVNTDGSIGDMRTLQRRIAFNTSFQLSFDGVRRIVPNPLGGCYVMVDFSDGVETLELYRLSEEGQTIWARSIGTTGTQTSWPEIFPTVGETGWAMNQANTRLVCSPSGEAYIINMCDDPLGMLKVKKISPEGEIDWVHGYEWLGQDPPYARCMAAAIDLDGVLHVLTRYAPFGTVHAAIRVDSDGTLLSADAFDVAGTGEIELMVGPDGERLLGLPGEIGVAGGAGFAMPALNILGTGGAIQRTQYPALVQEPYAFRPRLDTWNLSDGQLRVAGVLAREHQTFSTVENYPMIWSLPIETFQQCESSTSNGAYTTIPQESFNVTTDDAIVAVDITEQLSTATTVLYSGSTDQPYLLSAFCDLNVGSPHPPLSMKSHIRQSLLEAGEFLVVEPSEATHIDIIAMDGRTIFGQGLATAQEKIPTSSCSPGSYLVRASDADGSVRWCERVLLR